MAKWEPDFEHHALMPAPEVSEVPPPKPGRAGKSYYKPRPKRPSKARYDWPKSRKGRVATKYPWREVEVGGQFFVLYGDLKKIYFAARAFGYSHDTAYKCRSSRGGVIVTRIK